MKLNPIFRKDELTSARSLALPAMVTGLNTLFFLLVIGNLFYSTGVARSSGEVGYVSFLRIYYGGCLLELFLLQLYTPFSAAQALYGEKRSGQLALLLTTQLSSLEIVLGKLLSSLSSALFLSVTTLPILGTVYIYGGVTGIELLAVLSAFLFTGLYGTALGLFFSGLFRSLTAAVVSAYAVLSVSLAGFGLWSFLRFQEKRPIPLQGLPAAILFCSIVSGVLILLSSRLILPRRSRH